VSPQVVYLVGYCEPVAVLARGAEINCKSGKPSDKAGKRVNPTPWTLPNPRLDLDPY